MTVLWLLVMTQAINLIDGLDGLAAGIVAIAAIGFFLYANKLSDLSLLLEPQPRPAGGDHHRRRVRRVPAVQLQPGADLHGRQRRVPARDAAGGVDQRRRWPRRSEHTGLRRSDVLLLRPAGDPAADPRRADPRHPVRDRAPAVEAPGDRRRRQGPSPSPVDEPRPRPPPFGADPVGVDGAAVGLRAVSRAIRREPELPAVRHRRPRHRALHRDAPERSPQAGGGGRGCARPAGVGADRPLATRTPRGARANRRRAAGAPARPAGSAGRRCRGHRRPAGEPDRSHLPERTRDIGTEVGPRRSTPNLRHDPALELPGEALAE